MNAMNGLKTQKLICNQMSLLFASLTVQKNRLDILQTCQNDRKKFQTLELCYRDFSGIWKNRAGRFQTLEKKRGADTIFAVTERFPSN